MAKRENLALVLLKGAAAGLVSTAAVTLVVSQAPRLLHLTRAKPEVPGENRMENPSVPRLEKATEKLVEKVAHTTLHKPLNENTRRMADKAAFWGYGAILGMVYGVTQRYSRLPAALFGTMFGGAARFTDSILMSDMNTWPSEMTDRVPSSLLNTATRMFYAWITALTYNTLSRFV